MSPKRSAVPYVHVDGVARDGNDWLLADAIGSVRATVDTAGVVSAETAFTAFGEPLTGDADSFGFAGEQLDTTGLVHLRARQYNPTVGRFTTVDPVQPGAPGTTGYNLYTYAANNPTTFTDPTGQTVLVETQSLNSRAAQNASTIRAFQSGVQAARFELIVANFASTATTSGSALATAGGGAASAGGGSGVGAALIGAGVIAAGSLIVGGDTPELQPDSPIVLPPTITEPAPDGQDQAQAPELEPAADGAGARNGGPAGPCDSSSDLITVGRWMSEEEFERMEETGLVQVGDSGTTYVANPANPDSYRRQARAGSVYVEFRVPSSALAAAGQPDWAQIPSPDSVRGRLAQNQGNPFLFPVEACNIRRGESN